MRQIDFDALPEHIRRQITAADEAKPRPLFPIPPREYSLNFQTKEINELAHRVDLLISAANELHQAAEKPKKDSK